MQKLKPERHAMEANLEAGDVTAATPVCITGAPGSGMALVARVLQACGLWLGPAERLHEAAAHPIAGASWPALNLDAAYLNDQLLATWSAGWDSPPAQVREREFDDALAAWLEDASSWADLLADGASAAPGWGWANAGTALAMSCWRRAVPGLHTVACLRNPVSTALHLRDRRGHSLRFGLNLWHAYNQEVLAAVNEGACLVTHFDAWIIDAEAELARVLAWLGWDVAASQREAALALVDKNLRHHAPGSSRSTLWSAGGVIGAQYYALQILAGDVYATSPEGSTPPLVDLVAPELPPVATQDIAERFDTLHQLLRLQHERNAELAARVEGAPGKAAWYHPGQTIDFRMGGNAPLYATTGWAPPEPAGTWSRATMMVVEVRLSEQLGIPLRLSATLLPYVHPRHPETSLKLVLGAVELAIWTFNEAETQFVEAVIPAEHLNEGDVLRLEFIALNPVAPKALGLSFDERRLCVFMQEMALCWLDEPAADTE